MGLFSKFTQTSTPVQKDPLDPTGKSFDWFISQDGINSFNEYCDFKAYQKEESLRRDFKTDSFANSHDISFEMWVSVARKGSKIPSIYFKELVNNIKNQPFEYVGPNNMVIDELKDLAKPFIINDDGEPELVKLNMPVEKLLSKDDNPILYFSNNFHCFTLADDATGSWEDKIDLFKIALFFVSFETKNGNYDTVINDNSWIFDKNVYFNDLGTIRKKKGFLKQIIPMASNTQLLEGFLEDAEKGE